MRVTAIYNGSEIGYGQGDSATYAIEECIDSIDSMFIENVIDDIELHFDDIRNSGYPKFNMLTEFYYRERQYF
jgi:hypothetical protein